MFRFLNTLLLFALLATTAHAALTPERLRCEYLENPLGIDATVPPETPPPYVAPPPVVNVERQPTAEETAARQKVIDAEQAQARAVHNANVAAEAKQTSERVWVDKRENPPKVIENLDATLKAMKPPLEMVRVAPSGCGSAR